MIWDDPWVQLAMWEGTRLPPPDRNHGRGYDFRCTPIGIELNIETWIDLVGTRWTADEVRHRLEGAWISCLYDEDGVLVATCVLRPRPQPRPIQNQSFWILETLRARKGFGTPLLRAAIRWLYTKSNGPYVLGDTGELSAPALLFAWWRGWLGSASTIQYGYAFFLTGGACSFCPTSWSPLPSKRLVDPTLFRDSSGAAVVSDSGLGDGWGHVLVLQGEPDWSAIAKKGGWTKLWTRASTAPKGWAWTGEFVVIGLLNRRIYPEPMPVEWITAEIA